MEKNKDQDSENELLNGTRIQNFGRFFAGAVEGQAAFFVIHFDDGVGMTRCMFFE
jgi:hypothetical protein